LELSAHNTNPYHLFATGTTGTSPVTTTVPNTTTLHVKTTNVSEVNKSTLGSTTVSGTTTVPGETTATQPTVFRVSESVGTIPYVTGTTSVPIGGTSPVATTKTGTKPTGKFDFFSN
jgi:hypothetical protein